MLNNNMKTDLPFVVQLKRVEEKKVKPKKKSVLVCERAKVELSLLMLSRTHSERVIFSDLFTTDTQRYDTVLQ